MGREFEEIEHMTIIFKLVTDMILCQIKKTKQLKRDKKKVLNAIKHAQAGLRFIDMSKYEIN